MTKQELPALYRELIGYDNVIGVGRGLKRVRGEATGEEAAVILVNRKLSRSELRRGSIIPRRIGELPTDVIEVGDIRLLGVERTGKHRPAQPGLSIGHYQVSAGTFGAVVKDRSTGAPLILSNNHVLANLTDGSDDRAQIGDPILQPALYDGGDAKTAVIAHLKRFAPLHRDLIKPKCLIAQAFEALVNKWINIFQPHYRIQVMRSDETVNLVDCAVAEPISPDDVNPAVLEVGPIAGVKEPKPGMLVKKSGRSSGLTHSIVLATDVTVQIGLSHTQYSIFSDQVLAGPMSKPGDSGSLILTEDDYAIGLLFAGSNQATMFNRLDRVLDTLNVTL